MSTKEEDGELKSPLYVIREVYEDQDSYEKFIAELDKALDERYETIIIEPAKVGDETSRWIRVGNCLHKTAMISSIASIASAAIWPKNLHSMCACAAISTFCSSIYWISWSYDPCVKYQIETNSQVLKNKIPNYSEFSSPVVLKYKDNSIAKYIHRTFCLVAVSICLFRVYQLFRGNSVSIRMENLAVVENFSE
uniref:CSON005319 protein n=1 Tax=Culicoides sonorensis TaxID=179676 RepID=A0A336K8R9_CULSO